VPQEGTIGFVIGYSAMTNPTTQMSYRNLESDRRPVGRAMQVAPILREQADLVFNNRTPKHVDQDITWQREHLEFG